MKQTAMNKTGKLNQSLADIHTPLLYQHWYVAATAAELTRELMSRYILERNIVFYRKQDGRPVGLQNRCAHRSFPLSESILEGDDIVCGYHGIRYNADGVIVDVPCQNVCPQNKQIHKYPLKEIGPLIWIWMGDPDLADENLIPDTPYLDTNLWAYACGQYHVEGSYLLMHENLCDLSHFAYLHRRTFSFTRKHAASPVAVEQTGNQLTFFREGRVGDASIFFPPEYRIEERDPESISGGTFVSPALSLGWRKTTLNDVDDSEQKVLRTYVPHFLTPASQSSCHYFWFFARDYALDDQLFGGSFQETITRGFNEDMFAVREMQKILERDKHNFSEIHVAGDQPGNMMRRIVKQLADAEQNS